MSNLDDVRVAMEDYGLKQLVIAGAAFLKMENPQGWADANFAQMLGEQLGGESKSLAQFHVEALAAAKAAYGAILTNDRVYGAIQQRVQFLAGA